MAFPVETIIGKKTPTAKCHFPLVKLYSIKNPENDF
jgi:hypothetical protein